MDANLATQPDLVALYSLIGLIATSLITSITAIVLQVLNRKQSSSIEKKVDAGNVVATATHTIANGRTEALMRELAAKNEMIAELSRQLPPK